MKFEDDREADIPPTSPDASSSGTIRLGHIGGDLRLFPWRDAASGAGARIVLEDEAPLDLYAGDLAPDHLHGDVQVWVAASEIDIESVAGDLVAEHIDGTLTIGKIKGDTRLDAIAGGDISIERANGDVVARHIDGDLAIGTAKGDVVIDHAGGVRLG